MSYVTDGVLACHDCLLPDVPHVRGGQVGRWTDTERGCRRPALGILGLDAGVEQGATQVVYGPVAERLATPAGSIKLQATLRISVPRWTFDMARR